MCQPQDVLKDRPVFDVHIVGHNRGGDRLLELQFVVYQWRGGIAPDEKLEKNSLVEGQSAIAAAGSPLALSFASRTLA